MESGAAAGSIDTTEAGIQIVKPLGEDRLMTAHSSGKIGLWSMTDENDPETAFFQVKGTVTVADLCQSSALFAGKVIQTRFYLG